MTAQAAQQMGASGVGGPSSSSQIQLHTCCAVCSRLTLCQDLSAPTRNRASADRAALSCRWQKQQWSAHGLAGHLPLTHSLRSG